MKAARKLFGARIKEIRKERGMTQEDVAKIVNIEPTSYSRFERGERSATLDTIEKIAGALSVGLKDLFEFGALPSPSPEQTVEEAKEECVRLLDEASEEEIKMLKIIMRAVLR